MLVRLNQIDPRSADGAAGWTTGGVRGTVAHAWPETTFAYQLVAMDADEAGRPVPADARRAEVRRVLPAVIAAVGRAGEVAVVRLDGPFGPGLAPAVAAAAGASAYAVSAVQRFGFDAAPPLASVRLVADAAAVERLCGDERLDLHAGVRLRTFCCRRRWSTRWWTRWSRTTSGGGSCCLRRGRWCQRRPICCRS